MKYLKGVSDKSEYYENSVELNSIGGVSYIASLNEIRYPKVPDDMVAMYYGHSGRRHWGIDEVKNGVMYTFDKDDDRWLFPTFLYLEFNNADGENGRQVEFGDSQPGHYEPAAKVDWIWMLNRYFSEVEYFSQESGKNQYEGLRALDECIEECKGILGKPRYKHGVVLGIPAPSTNFTEWGSLDSGVLDFTVAEDKLAAVKWFIDEAISRFNSANYKNIVLKGFYWIEENAYMTGWTKHNDGYITTNRSDGEDDEYYRDETKDLTKDGVQYYGWTYKQGTEQEEVLLTKSATPSANAQVYDAEGTLITQYRVAIFQYWTNHTKRGGYNYITGTPNDGVSNKKFNDIITDVAQYVHGKKFKFYWLPYNNAYGNAYWEDFGFDRCDMQTGYLLKTNRTDDELNSMCNSALSKGKGVMFEAPRTLLSNNEVLFPRMSTLLDVFEAKKIFGGSDISYYLDNNLLIDMCNTNDEDAIKLVKRLFTYVCDRNRNNKE